MIFETIVTSQSRNGAAHIAPMGVHAVAADFLIMPFRPSKTLDNLLETRCAVINMTDDVRIFAGCLTGRRDWPLSPAEQISCPRLSDALAHVEVEVIEVTEDELRPRLRCRSVHDAQHHAFRGFNRAQFSVLEAAILISRLHMLPPEKVDSELAYLRIGIEKTAGPRELEAWEWLLERRENHRQNAIRAAV